MDSVYQLVPASYKIEMLEGVEYHRSTHAPPTLDQLEGNPHLTNWTYLCIAARTSHLVLKIK